MKHPPTLRKTQALPNDSDDHAEHYAELTTAYLESARAVDNQELGWGLFICQK